MDRHAMQLVLAYNISLLKKKHLDSLIEYISDYAADSQLYVSFASGESAAALNGLQSYLAFCKSTNWSWTIFWTLLATTEGDKAVKYCE